MRSRQSVSRMVSPSPLTHPASSGELAACAPVPPCATDASARSVAPPAEQARPPSALNRFLRLARTSKSAGLASLALDTGYSDQAHLTREAGHLAGMTPRAIVTQPTG